MLTATAPNAAIPIGLRKKPALDAAAEVKGHAAGVLHIAPDGDILLLRRAGTPGKDNFVGHWALPGGGVEEGETPQAGAARENKEEMGVDVDPDALRDLDKTLTPNGMAFHTFAHPVEKKFSPQLNDEHSGAGWFGLHELPRPMHPAVEKMLQDKLGIRADSKPEEFAGARDGLVAWAKSPMAADATMTIDLDDDENQLARLLAYIKENSEVGHSFDVVVDPSDPELAKKFYIDGDGAFRIRGLKIVKEDPAAADDLSAFALDAVAHDPSNGQFTSGGGGGSTGPNHHIIHEKGDPRPKASEAEARMLGLNKPAKADTSKHEGKKSISSEALTAKLKGMSEEKLHAALKNDDIDPMIKAHIQRHLTSRLMGSDSQIIAMDRDSVRSIDRDGRMHVAIANLSKEQIRPYVGREMPGWEKLGLDPDKVYNLYCPGEELEKAAATFNGIQLLKKHTPVNADDHKKNDIVGTTGTNAKYVAPFLQNSLSVWTQEAIDFIESEEQKELSCGYHYIPVMTPGVFQGQPYDGVMTQLAGNHISLVESGRAGDECVVGDNAEALQWAAIERAVMDLVA